MSKFINSILNITNNKQVEIAVGKELDKADPAYPMLEKILNEHTVSKEDNAESLEEESPAEG